MLHPTDWVQSCIINFLMDPNVLLHLLPELPPTAERKYSQIEKETLACVYGIKKFHSYIYGRRFHIVTADHKPLLSLHQHHAIPTTTSNRIRK